MDMGKLDEHQSICKSIGTKKPEVFLVSPSEKKFLWRAGDRLPLGLLYISKALSENGVENQVFDLNHYETRKFVEKVKNESPAWVGLSIISSPSFNQIKKMFLMNF